MRKSIMMAAMLLCAPGLSLADDGAWGAVGGGSVGDAPQSAIPASSGEAACGQDDPRMQNLIAVLKDVRAGNKVEPLKMRFGTYMGMSNKIRKMLGDNIIITTANCKQQFIFGGELTGKVEMPFPEAMTYINDALRARDAATLNFIFTNVKAAPDTLHNIMSYSVARAFPLASGKALIQAANIQAVRSDDKSMGILLLNLYQALGGTLISGGKNEIQIYSRGGTSNVVYLVLSGGGFQVTVGSSDWLKLKDSKVVTDMSVKNLSEAYASIGVPSHFIVKLPEK